VHLLRLRRVPCGKALPYHRRTVEEGFASARRDQAEPLTHVATHGKAEPYRKRRGKPQGRGKSQGCGKADASKFTSGVVK
jgi:hypothetical protein